MADKTITQLTVSAELTGSEELPVWQDNATRKTTVQDIVDLAEISAGSVASVNGETGVVVLDAADVGAATAAQGGLADSAVQPGDLALVATSGSYLDLADKPTLSSVANTGEYVDLINKPTFAAVATTGAYSDLSGTPTLSAVATSNDYNDLNNLPSGADGKLAVWSNPGGDLIDFSTLGYNENLGLEYYQNDSRENPPSETYRSIHRLTHDLNLTEEVLDENTTYFQYNFTHDQGNSGFNYGDNGFGGVNFLQASFNHNGAGHLGSYQHNNNWINLGDSNLAIEGTCGYTSLYTGSINVHSGYEVLGFLQLHNSYINIMENAGVDSLQGLSVSLDLETNSSVTQYVTMGNIYVQTDTGSTLPNTEMMTLRTNIAGNASNVNGLNIDFNNTGTIASATGSSVNFAGSASLGSAVAYRAVMGNYDTTSERRVAFESSNGSLNINHEITTSPNIFFDQGNILFTMLRVTDGDPITSTSFIANNLSSGFIFEDSMDGGILGLGATGVGFVGQVAVAENKTASLINFAVGGFSIPNSADIGNITLGGTLERANMFTAAGAIDQGGDNDLIIDEIVGFFMPAASMGTSIWGIKIDHPDAHNQFRRSLSIGAAETVANAGVALHISDKKALQLTAMNETERDALTPSDFMIIALDDGVNKKLQYYNGTAWTDL